MVYEVIAIEEKDFPVVTVRTSKYKVILNRFLESQLERGRIDAKDIKTSHKTIQTALRKLAKKQNKDLEIVVDENKVVFIKKL